MNIRGKKGLRLREAWHTGPQTYPSLAVPEFPNMFIITGLEPVCAYKHAARDEQNVDWITDLLSHVIQNNYAEIGVAQTKPKSG